MLLTLVSVVAGAAGLGWLLRAMGGRSDDTVSLPEGALAPFEQDSELDDEEHASDEVIALTSDGWAFIRAPHGVHLVPPGDTMDACAPSELGNSHDEVTLAARQGQFVNPRTGGRLASCRPRETISAGDLVGLRVHRGAPDHDPWRLEALGRDGEYRAWRFETRDAADTAAEIVQPIVRPRRDADGEPQLVTDADFAEAIRQEALTEAEFGLPTELFGEDEEQRT